MNNFNETLNSFPDNLRWRYLDGFSRATGQISSYFSLFDNDELKRIRLGQFEKDLVRIKEALTNCQEHSLVENVAFWQGQLDACNLWGETLRQESAKLSTNEEV